MPWDRDLLVKVDRELPPFDLEEAPGRVGVAGRVRVADAVQQRVGDGAVTEEHCGRHSRDEQGSRRRAAGAARASGRGLWFQAQGGHRP